VTAQARRRLGARLAAAFPAARAIRAALADEPDFGEEDE